MLHHNFTAMAASRAAPPTLTPVLFDVPSSLRTQTGQGWPRETLPDLKEPTLGAGDAESEEMADFRNTKIVMRYF